MYLLILYLVGVVFIILFLLIIYFNLIKFKYRDVDKLPGPKTYPIIGNIPEFGTNTVDFFQNVRRLTQQYGTMFRFWIGPYPTIMVSDPKHLEYFLTFTNKTKAYQLFEPWLGKGLITSNGEKWRNRRKMLTPTFHFKIIDDFFPIFESCGKILIEKLKEKCKENKPFDVYPMLTLYALDVICETSMGIKINAQNNPAIEYVCSVKVFTSSLMERYFSLIKRNPLLVKFTKMYKTLMYHVNILKSFTNKIIQQRKDERLKQIQYVRENEFGIKPKTALLDLLLNMAEKNALSDEDIREEVDTFMFAGHDSISSTLTLLLLELTKHPDVQTKLLEEIQAELGHDKDCEIDMRKICNMKYFDCVIKESLRLFATVPYIERELSEDIIYEGLHLPAGIVIVFMFFEQHRSEEHFPNPESFLPERFLPENSIKRHPYAFVPFSAGARNCIGQKYAMMDMKCALAQVIMHFELHPSPGHKLVLGSDASLKCANGAEIILKQR